MASTSAQEVVSPRETPTGHWQLTGAMSERREYAGGVLLEDGSVLAVSGHPLKGKSIASAELFDPKSNSWSGTGSLRQARNGGNGATRLLDGRVVLAGGHNNSQVIVGTEVFDPARRTWSDAGTLSVARDPTATLLADGRVLVAGGIDWYIGEGKAYAVAELFDPSRGEWDITGSLSKPRYEARMVRLDDDRVLIVGGYSTSEYLLASTEIYDPASGRWSPAAWRKGTWS